MAFIGAGPRIDFILDPNTDNPCTFLFMDENGGSIDFTGSTFRLEVKIADGNDDPAGPILLTLTTGSGLSGTLASGEFNVTFPDDGDGGLAGPARYVYTCLRISGGAAVEPHCWGFIDVGAGVASL